MGGPRRYSPVLTLVAAALSVWGAATAVRAVQDWQEAAAYARAAPCTRGDVRGRCVLDVLATVARTDTREGAWEIEHVVWVQLNLPGEAETERLVKTTVVRPDPLAESRGPRAPVRVRVWRGDPTRITWNEHTTETVDAPANAATGTTATALLLLAAGAGAAAIRLGRNGPATGAAAVVLGAYVAADLPSSFDPRFAEPPHALAAFLLALTGSGWLFVLSRRVAAASRPTPPPARPAGR